MKLGLIGKGIANSSSPDLHARLGSLAGIDVSYDLFDVDARPIASLEDKVRALIDEGYRGVNVTYPFKEQALALADDISVGARRVGATNTLVFEGGRIIADNTDFSGFMSGYRATLGERPPGRVLLVGTGGVGKAAAFAVAELGATDVRLADLDAARAEALASELRHAGFTAQAVDAATLGEQAAQCDGLINCTPIGHEKSPGCPLDPSVLRPDHWIFDAVYVPAVTEFVAAARQAGAGVMSGVSLFVFQGVDAFKRFCEDEHQRAAADEQAASLFAHYRRELLKENL
ncbi:shikimate dehydrogenase [Halomonas sp. DP5Y7-2]|uniref:shikimate dehydrogenase family protein n=1 Tax=Halomonas sp. DP5Y7-2 TaxID=2859076 RepID=UPI001C99D56D|nr:shikimate dehydrogenase [Halomonas sp. DP5Y7-2]MBY5985616.1 shikimate dehydrogenase [Halomonas sp. DP5Y7-2]